MVVSASMGTANLDAIEPGMKQLFLNTGQSQVVGRWIIGSIPDADKIEDCVNKMASKLAMLHNTGRKITSEARCDNRKQFKNLSSQLIKTTLNHVSLNENVWNIAFVSKSFLTLLCERLKRKNESFKLESYPTYLQILDTLQQIQDGTKIFEVLTHELYRTLKKIHVRSENCVHCDYIKSAVRLIKYETKFQLVTVQYKVENAAGWQANVIAQNIQDDKDDVVIKIPKEMKELRQNIHQYVDALNKGETMSLETYCKYLNVFCKLSN